MSKNAFVICSCVLCFFDYRFGRRYEGPCDRLWKVDVGAVVDRFGTMTSRNIKVRALVVDGRVKEYVLGAPHEVTDRLFVVRRVFRVNDSLPEDSGPRWQWQRGGWLLVDRVTGHVSPINLPEFDASIPPRVGIATMWRIAESRKMERRRLRWWRSSAAASRF